MAHWTEKSSEDFAYDITLDFITQLENKLDAINLDQKGLAERLNMTPGAVSQFFSNENPNPKIETLVRHCRAIGMKLALVAYDDSDPDNNRGPIFSEIFAQAWQAMGCPRDLSQFQEQRVMKPESIFLEDAAISNDVNKKKGAQGTSTPWPQGGRNQSNGENYYGKK